MTVRLRERPGVSDPAATITTGTDAKGPRTRTYYPLAHPGRRRHWLLTGPPAVEVMDPRYDYTRSVLVGEVAGRGWQHRPSRDLHYHIAAQVRGWCWPEQGLALRDLAAESFGNEGAIVEVGSAWGLSATWTGWGIRASGNPDRTLTCVDTFADLPASDRRRQPGGSSLAEFQANIHYAGLDNHVTVLRARSEQAAANWEGGPIGQLYIDAWHTYQAVKGDTLLWRRHLADCAIVGFDDCAPDFPGVLRWQQELADLPEWTLLGRAGRMLIWRYQP
jgi:hypothetical protein